MSLARPAAVILDLDGTILESEKLARHCFLAACAELDLPDVDIAVYNRCIGTTEEVTEQIMRGGFGPEFPYEAISQRWSEIYQTQIAHGPIARRPGIETLIRTLRELQIPMAVATSSRRPTVEAKLDRCGLADNFEFYICGGETERGKPDPAPYVSALERLARPADLCWAIEDSDNGVRSAHAAGLTVFQIPDELEPSDDVRKLGHDILRSPLDLIAQLI